MASQINTVAKTAMTKKPHAVMDFAIFSKYAEMLDKNLEALCEKEKDKFLYFTPNTITIMDQYPKAKYHMLVLPRVKAPPRTTTNLKSLRQLFSSNVPKEDARKVIQEIAEDALEAKAAIEADMMALYRFKWDVRMGFHAVQSMDHIHLHVMSADLNGKFMKTRKHYNSFSPNLGYFLPLSDVLEWFEAVESVYDTRIKEIKYKQDSFRDKLGEPITCHHCDKNFDNRFADFRRHLEEIWQAFLKREQARADARELFLEKKRAREEKEAEKKATGTEGSATSPIEIDED